MEMLHKKNDTQKNLIKWSNCHLLCYAQNEPKILQYLFHDTQQKQTSPISLASFCSFLLCRVLYHNSWITSTLPSCN